MADISFKKLYKRVLELSTVNIKGVHGPKHWARVLRNGLFLCEKENHPAKVVKCFALMHDSQRLNDYEDPEHGIRAAELAYKLNDTHLLLSNHELEQLIFACSYHTFEEKTDDPVVHLCWDADRLDLGRIGIEPDPDRLWSTTAKHIAEYGQYDQLDDFNPPSLLDFGNS